MDTVCTAVESCPDKDSFDHWAEPMETLPTQLPELKLPPAAWDPATDPRPRQPRVLLARLTLAPPATGEQSRTADLLSRTRSGCAGAGWDGSLCKLTAHVFYVFSKLTCLLSV